MKDLPSNNSTSQFLKTDGGKTKSNAIESPSISLPKGGGAIKGIDEKFSVNAVNGTAGFSVPLPFSPAREVSPSHNIAYNSGAGNGIFGLGWNLDLPSIKRKTDKGLPQYMDTIDSDTFLFSEAEDLVPAFQKNEEGSFTLDDKGNYIIHEKLSEDSQFTIRYYKPRIEGLFARIERWTNNLTREIKWRVTTRDNITTLFGWTNQARIANPADTNQIYEWLPEFVLDDKGNCAHYLYKKENLGGIDLNFIHNRNRIKDDNICYTNTYLKKVCYGNKTPYKQFGNAFPDQEDYFFSTVFDYGEHDGENPENITKEWDFRKDAFSDYKAGFEIRTTRLCKRILLFHHFKGEGEYDGLVNAIQFDYDTSSEEDFTFLKAVTSFGYIKKADGTYSHKKLPPMEFEYQKHEWNKEVKRIESEDLVHAPSGLDEHQYQFTDLYNEGLSGILTEQANGWYYKHNLGDGKFEQAKLVSPKPSFAGLGAAMQLADLGADGGKQLVSFGRQPKGFFELDDNNEWQNFKAFKQLPKIDLGDPNIRWLDLNGDGKPEIVVSEEKVFTWYASEGREGFAAAQKATKPFDEEEGPHIVFADAKQSIFLADMSGDGMTDIVRIRNGEICYWPNLGYGKFGAKVAMDNAPVFDYLDSFNPNYIRLADINGSGVTDIIYLGKSKFTCWLNLSGNAFSKNPFEIDPFPEIDAHARITVADILGNGVACIVWSSALPKNTHTPLKYIDLMNSKKPHVMVGYKNNMGKEVSMEYAPSTKFYIEDKKAGNPWVTKLHFPVHCIVKTETRDKISGYRFVSSYKYHHGYYDHAEREFRGFGMVEQIDSEHFEHWKKGDASNITDATLHQEPVVSKTWFHTGAYIHMDKILKQYAHEYWYEEMRRKGFDVIHYENDLPDARLTVADGLDTDVLDKLSAQELRESQRACKGMALRSEVFAQDAVKYDNTAEAKKRELIPFQVATHNCKIQLIQPKGKNKHAVYTVLESEAISYEYERNPEDPRVAHNINLKVDEYGNVLESAAIVYPRRNVDETLPSDTQAEQAKTTIIYTHNAFSNDVIDGTNYRLRLPSEVKAFELKHLPKTENYYTQSDFENILTTAKELVYEDFDNELSEETSKRCIEHVRSIYLSNDLLSPLPLNQLESLGFPYESYQLAYTPSLIEDVFGDKVNDILMEEGRFTHSEGDENWWVRSGTVQFRTTDEAIEEAKNRFYLPLSYTDPYGAVTSVKYYKDYYLFIEATTNALGHTEEVEAFNFRTLSPQVMKDINGNLSIGITDELGLVKAMAVMGIGDEADNLDEITAITDSEETELLKDFFNATNSIELAEKGKTLLKGASTRFIYDFENYIKHGKPAVVASIAREQHYAINPDAAVQIGFEYSNGVGEVVMQKTQAEPGTAKKVVIDGESISIEEVNTALSEPQELRWIGNGRTINNNKGNPVKQYEPYFSVSWHYEDAKELVESGVTPVLYYDALGRNNKTELPDGTFTKVVYNAWRQEIHDANDTVLESEWYKKRTDSTRSDYIVDTKARQAAEKSAKHGNTPGILQLDSLGRPVLSVEHNRNADGEDEFYHTKVKLDSEGNLRFVTDARGNIVMRYKYDMLGNMVYQNSMDAGRRWLLQNIAENPLRNWDERNHTFQYFYDILQRPTYSKVTVGDGETMLDNIFDRIIYGEDLLTTVSSEEELKAKNMFGKPVKQYDTGGLIEIPAYDFKGQPLSTTRRLFKKYKEVTNWTDENLESDLEEEAFTFSTETDALGRITKQTAPDGSIITPEYNKTGVLTGEKVNHVNPETGALTEDKEYIKHIAYNEKGQREKIVYGNDVSTRFHYDQETFRLTHLESRKKDDANLLQDLHYTYDPSGNITHIEDQAHDSEFFNNRVVEPINTYTYDALYRLIEATGRENDTSLTFATEDNWNDTPFMQDNPLSVRNYNQKYSYDAVGNILQMQHKVGGANNWTRKYTYAESNNRLLNTQVGDNKYDYPHHEQHGYITKMPHLEDMGWNFKEELVKTIRQRRTDGTPETTYYQYDGSGQRIRKITENEATSGSTPTKKDERIYIAGYETYRTYKANTINFERTSLSLMDEGHRFVMVETVVLNTEAAPSLSERAGDRLIRYQLHNHLGSAALELDDTARVISYEEYHPFGTSAYQAKNAAIKAAAKRYRYTGMERDEETGLEYHSARYYLPWLGRWLNADPIGIGDGVNVYSYVKNNPTRLIDPSGNYSAGEGTTSIEHFLRAFRAWEEEITPESTQYLRVIGEAITFRGHVPIYEKVNHAKIRIWDHDYRKLDKREQIVQEVGGRAGYSYASAHFERHGDKNPKYVDAGLPIDMEHFFNIAAWAQDYPDFIVRWGYLREEYKQADVDPKEHPGGFSSAFAPEDLFSNELGLIFGTTLGNSGNDINLGDELEIFFNEIKILFTEGSLENGKYLTQTRIERLVGLAEKYYGTSNLTDFNKNSPIYRISEISIINNNAANRSYPFYNQPTP